MTTARIGREGGRAEGREAGGGGGGKFHGGSTMPEGASGASAGSMFAEVDLLLSKARAPQAPPAGVSSQSRQQQGQGRASGYGVVQYDGEEDPIEVMLDAVTCDDTATVARLLGALETEEEREALMNQCGECGDTPLTRAACEGGTEVARFLLDAKADVNLCDQSGYRPLTWAAMENEAP